LGKLLAFRHAEAAVNRPDLFEVGHADKTYPLTDTGISQAQKAGQWATETFDWVAQGDFVAATSEFVRTQQTYRQMRLPESSSVIYPGFNEQDWGDFMGANPPEQLRPSFDAGYELTINVKAPHGESSHDLYERASAALSELLAQQNTDNLVIVAHGRTLIVLRMLIEGVPPTDVGWHFMRQHIPELPNCGALYYPELNWPYSSTCSDKRVAILNPPYDSFEHFPWHPFSGELFKTATSTSILE